jgi:hypothetical protein
LRASPAARRFSARARRHPTFQEVLPVKPLGFLHPTKY